MGPIRRPESTMSPPVRLCGERVSKNHTFEMRLAQGPSRLFRTGVSAVDGSPLEECERPRELANRRARPGSRDHVFVFLEGEGKFD